MKSILIFVTAILASFFMSCSSKTNENTQQTQKITKSVPVKKTTLIQRNKNFFEVSEDSLRLAFKVENKIDRVLILLNDSMQKRKKEFTSILAAYEKKEYENEIVYYLYPEFITRYSTHPEDNSSGKTTMTIHLLKKDRTQRDTLIYSWVEGDERKMQKKIEKRILNKDFLFTEIGTPVGYNNVYHQTKEPKAMVAWILNVLCNDSPLDELKGDCEQFYNPEMQWNSASSTRFIGISAVH